ncbi:hypothetical protein D5R81_09710 [Parashewanella spongiae]|uniref:Transposase IS200-like domain-containing protein n=1 Tax=Parashewanella spongiae TaxID=342950 RepID=A0A3A6TTS6_9GAMM|nr:hypothetical protein D5R81_09710 [Parashewanella spongiae]
MCPNYYAKLSLRSNVITTVLYVGNNYVFINFTCTLYTYIALSREFNYCNWYYKSLSHTRLDCKYHVVFILKRRQKLIFGTIRKHFGDVFIT